MEPANVWHQLKRERIDVARCIVERLMKQLKLQGVVRGRRCRTTISDGAADRPSDLVNRQFTAARPNQPWVADITFLAIWSSPVYVASITDIFAGRIVGLRVSKSMRTDPALDALEQAIWSRGGAEGVIHHSDRGSRHLSIRYTDRLVEAGLEPSVSKCR